VIFTISEFPNLNYLSMVASNPRILPHRIANLSNCTKPSIAINDDGIVLVGFQADAKYVIGTKPKRNDRPGAPSRRVYTRMLQGDQWQPFKEFSYNVTTNSVNPVVASEGDDFVIAWKVQGQDKIAYSKNDGGDDWRNWSTYQTITASGIDYPGSQQRHRQNIHGLHRGIGQTLPDS
jgi:hypothetical protein